VKGKQQPVTIFEVLSAPREGQNAKELTEVFERGRNAYKGRDWRSAKAAFEEVLQRWPNDGPSRVFLARCEEYLLEEPAADWDGVYEMKHK